MKKKKIFLITILVIILSIIALLLFGIFKAKKEIPAKWESDIYQHSKHNCQVKNVLIILPSGNSLKEVVKTEGNTILSMEYGNCDIKAFTVEFSTPSDSGVTVYKYNPLTNELKSGQRIYHQVGRERVLPVE